MPLLALDIGTHMGFRVGTPAVNVGGVWDFSDSRFEGGGMRFLKFTRRLNETLRSLPFNEVVFEEVRAHKGTDAAHIYGGFLATLTAWCEERSIPYEGIGVAAIKQFACGKGNASKEEVITAVQARGFPEINDDNSADATALWLLRQRDIAAAAHAA